MINFSKISFFVFLLCVVYESILCDEWPSPVFLEKTKPVNDKCKADGGLDDDFISSVRKGNLEESEKLKGYLLCIFKTHDLIDYEHHEFEYWKILGMLPKEMKKPAFEMGKGCLHINGQDYGKASLEFIKCLHKANSEHFAFLI